MKTADLSGCASLTSIGSYVFYNCAALTEVNFGENSPITTIGNYAFYGCSSLKTADLSGCASLTSIGIYAFYNCADLTEVNFCENSPLETIGNYAFYGCSSLETADLSGCTSLTSIGNCAFYNCSSLETADLSECTNLTSIGSSAFYNCAALTDVSFNGDANLTTLTYDSSYPIFGNCTNLQSVDFTGCSSLTGIPASTFSSKTNLKEVSLDGCTSLATIDSQAFYNCVNLKEITIPENVETIGSQAFYGCSSLETINYNAANATSVGTNAFRGVGLTTDLTLNISNNVDRLPDSIFADGVKISEINFEGVNESLILGVDALKSMGRPLSDMSDGTTEYYVDEFGVIYSKDRTELYYIPQNLTSYTVPAGVTTIKKDSCRLAESLTSLTFENISDITTLESNAFAECKTLTSITSDGTTVFTVEDAENLFENASIGLHAFYNTGLLDIASTSELSSEPIQTATMNGTAKEYELTVSFTDSDKLGKLDSVSVASTNSSVNRIPSVEPVNEDIYYYLTNEVATLNVSVSAFSAGADTESGNDFEKYARVFFQCSSDNVIFENYIVGMTTTITNTSGVAYEVTFKQVENSNIYYLEFAMPYGNTVSFDSRVYVPNLTDQNATMKMWIQIAEDTEEELWLTPEKYQEAQWYTAIPKWSVKQTASATEYGFVAVSTENGNIPKIKNDISFNIANSKTTTSSKSGYGIDPTKSLTFTEWLTLPDGIEWEDHVIEAIKNGDYYCTGTSPYIYLNTSEGTVQLAYISVTSEDVSVVWDDEKGSPVITWKVKNKNLSSTTITNDANYDMSTQNYSIKYNADVIFKIADDYDFTQKSRIYSNVIQNPEYVFAEPNDTTKHTINTDETEVRRDSVFEQASQISVVIGTAKADISLTKSAVYNGNTYSQNNSYFTMPRNASIKFTLKAKNSGYVPGTITRVADPLPTMYTLHPEDMQAMFNDIYGKEFVITIKNGYKDTSDVAERTCYQRKRRGNRHNRRSKGRDNGVARYNNHKMG